MKKYYRFRVKSPRAFQKGSLRTLDVGRKGHTKIVIGRPKGMRATRTQSVLIAKGKGINYAKAKKIFRRVI